MSEYVDPRDYARNLLRDWVEKTVATYCTEQERFKVAMVLSQPSEEMRAVLENAEEAVEVAMCNATADVLNASIYAEGLETY